MRPRSVLAKPHVDECAAWLARSDGELRAQPRGTFAHHLKTETVVSLGAHAAAVVLDA